jgi:hypothetical protein
MDSCTTNSILRETKYSQTLTKRSVNVSTIAGRDVMIVDSKSATITFSNCTQVMIDDALFYLDSTRTLISFRDIRKSGLHICTHETTKRSFSLLLSLSDMAMKFYKEFLLLHLDCTTYTLNPYHMLYIM